MFHVAFTGTHYGMSENQKDIFYRLISNFDFCSVNITRYFHHGDCIGSDKQAHDLVFNLSNAKIIIHPPTNPKRRAFCKNYFEIRPEDEYIKRDHKMIDECSVLIATPHQNYEILRSGTWATIRYARKKKIPIYILFPDGSIKVEKLTGTLFDFTQKE